MNKKVGIVIALVAFAAAILTLLMLRQNPEPVIMPLTESWEKAVPFQEIPDGLVSLSAESCGSCHQQHYEEWKTSTHAHAWTDMQYQAELKKESSPYMCINCHIPLENQQEYIVDGLIDGDVYKPSRRKNERWDMKLQQEGITCVACHLRGDAIVGTMGSEKAPHRTVKDPKFLSESLCISCHNAVATITPEVTCNFETGDEWKHGGYASEKNCISCHMEEVQRPIFPGYEEWKSHYHSFPGSGIPKVAGETPGMLKGLEFYPGEMKRRYAPGEPVEYSLDVKNEYAGHRVPTGDPERFILINFTLTDENGKLVKKDVERIGEKWQWHPVAKKLGDNNLDPKEERSYNGGFEKLKKGKYTLNIEVTKHRMDEKTAHYNKLTDAYPLFISIYEKSYSFEVRD